MILNVKHKTRASGVPFKEYRAFYYTPGDALLMSDIAKVLDYTLSDHDLLVGCAGGIKDILTKLDEMDKRVTKVEERIKNVEDWKLRVMAIVGSIGLGLGFLFGKILPVMLGHSG